MLPAEPRTVKPRKPTVEPWLPLVVADRESRSIFCEMTGEVHGWTDAASLFRAHPACIVIAPNAAQLLVELDAVYAADEMWQYRATPVKRERYNPDPTRRRRVTADTIVNYFGWRGTSYTNRKGGKSNRKGHWHYPVDPNLFSQAILRDLMGGTGPGDLLVWGKDVREWCHANGLKVSPTAGGLGGQLLRDPRWYPAARRKVPRATNARARTVLPGNHYRLYWPTHRPVNATYLDMSGSHHIAASRVTFPSSNYLFARGNFRVTDTTETPVAAENLWAPKGTERYERILDSHGLLRLQLNVPALKADQFPPPYMEAAGRRIVYVYTNELPLIRRLGADIEGVDAAWTAYDEDPGLNRYAEWAITETATMSPQRKRWAKTVLLATYGNLAAKARVLEFGYRTGNGGFHRDYPAGPYVLPVIAHVGDIEREVPTVNVIHRGMIEAEQRKTVLDMASELRCDGHRILSIYADAIMVRSGARALPLLPPPWRVEAHLTRLRFATATSFMSEEMTKLPGIARDDRDRWARLAHFRRNL